MKRLVPALVVLVLLVAAVFWLWPRSLTRADLLAALDKAITDLEAPGATIQDAADALATPEAAATFVRDHIHETTYQGAVFEPKDVLLQRVGNRMDRARLLVALIEAQGGSAQIMGNGEPATRAQLATQDVPDSYLRLADLLEIDTETETLARFETLLQEMLAEIDGSQTLLTETLTIPQAKANPRDIPHLWVVAKTDEVETSLALGPDAVPESGRPITPEVAPVAIRLTGTSRDGRRHVLLDHKGPVAGHMALSFQPVVGPAEAFGKPPAPDTVSVWAPVLTLGDQIVSGSPFTPAGEIPPSREGAPPLTPDDADAPEVIDFAVPTLDTTNAPEIRATVTGELPEGAVWQSAWLGVTDGGMPVRPRLLSLPRDGSADRPVLLLVDASSSMADQGRIFAARRMAQAVMMALPDGTALTVAGLNGLIPGITRMPNPPLDSPRDGEAELVDKAFTLGNGYSLAGSIRALLPQLNLEQAPDVILIGDGALSDPQPVLQRVLRDTGARLYAIAVDAPVQSFSGLGPAWQWTTTDGPEKIVQDLMMQRAAQAQISWPMPADATAGTTRTVEITPLGGGSEPVTVTYTVPELADTQPDDGLIALMLEVTLPDGTIRTRPLMALGPDADPWALEMAATLTLAPGAAPDAVLAGAALREWRALAAAQDAATAGEALPGSYDQRRFAALQRVASLSGLTSALTGDAPQPDSPIAVLERFEPFPEGDTLVLRRTLDVLHDGNMISGPRAGLALAAAEAHLIGGDSVNARLMKAEDRQTIRPTDPLPDWAQPLLTDAPDGTALIASQSAGAGWLLQPGGQLQARLMTPLAKGATDVQVAAQFKDLRSRLGMISVVSGAAGSVAGVSGIAHGGLVGLLDQNLRMWCFSSVMMGYVGDAIAGLPTPGEGNPEAWKARALSLCELSDPDGLARAYAANMGANMAAGALGDALGALSGALFTQGMANRAGEIYRQLPRTPSAAETGGMALGWGGVLWLSDLSGALNAALVTDRPAE